MSYENLLSAKKIGNLEIRNRVVIPPMGLAMGDGSGLLNERHKAFYESLAKGGAGLIISTASCVCKDYCGIAEPGMINLAVEGNSVFLHSLMDGIHAYGAKMIFQLLHPGRQASSAINNGQQPVGPSALREADFLEMPRELTVPEIKDLVGKYVNAARVVFDAGCDGVELHAAHGYLLNEFLSPRANQRTDEYGGTFEKRMRFITEIVEGILAIKPENAILCVRMNAMDGMEGGIEVDDAVEIAKYLEKIGVEAIDVSSGTYSRTDLIIDPAIADEGNRTNLYTRKIKEAISIPLISPNNIKRPCTAEAILASGVCDFVCMGRSSLADAEIINKIKAGKEDQIQTCISCNYCEDCVESSKIVNCSVNPIMGNEQKYANLVRNGEGRQVVVIGGGPGGIQAALLAAEKGFKVTLFEKQDALGGELLLANKAPGKQKIDWTLDAYRARIKAQDIDVRLNTEIKSVAQVEELHPYAVIVANGSVPSKPPISGLDMTHVIQARDVLENPNGYTGKKIVLVGSGMTGLETAEVLVEQGNSVSIFEMLDEIAKGANVANKSASMRFLESKGTSFHVLHRLEEVTEKEAIFNRVDTDEKVSFPADLVVLSLGIKADKSVMELLKDMDTKLYAIGDCAGGVRVVDATSAAYETVWDL